jgi:hypothetical protein
VKFKKVCCLCAINYLINGDRDNKKCEIEKRSLSPSEGYLGNCLYSELMQCAFKLRQSFTAGLIKKKRVLMCNLCPNKNTVHHDLNLPKHTRRSALKLIGSSPLWLGGLITGCGVMSAANAQIPANVELT